MKGFTFHLEHDSSYKKRKGIHSGNVIAKLLGSGSAFRTCGVPLPNDRVALMPTDPGWVRTYCKRISEKKAREIHPRLFEQLDGKPS